jgi:hypothetical protein
MPNMHREKRQDLVQWRTYSTAGVAFQHRLSCAGAACGGSPRGRYALQNRDVGDEGSQLKAEKLVSQISVRSVQVVSIAILSISSSASDQGSISHCQILGNMAPRQSSSSILQVLVRESGYPLR